MKELLQQYAAYNVWANNILLQRAGELPEEKITQEIASSFPSLHKTVAHMWFAEEAWWQRVAPVENAVLLSKNFAGNFSELCTQFAKQSRQWAAWVDSADENKLNHLFNYIRNNEPQQMKVHDMLLHLFNHATYHRGQLVTLLRQLGEDNIPSSDFSAYCRQRK
jgi:uncharacterized damage-inducible protein DinB